METKRATTTAGQAWLEKYLHPPSRSGESISGIPDRATNSSAVIDWKTQQTIGAPAGTGSGTWNILIIGLNNPRVPAVVLRWIGTPATVADYLTNVVQNNTMAWGLNSINWRNAVAQFRPCASSITTYLDVADLYNQGMVAVCQSSLSELDNTHAGTNPVFLDRTLDADNLPTTLGDVIQTSPRYYTSHAKYGTFSVHTFSDPAFQYERQDPEAAQLVGFVPQGQIRIDLGDGTQLTGTQQPKEWVPAAYLGMSSSYTLYTGLLQQATVVIKACQSYEVIVPPRSIWTSFVTMGAPPDSTAMDMASEARFHMMDASESANNDLGSLWAGLKKMAPALASTWKIAKLPLKTAIGAIPGGGVINTILDGAEGLLTDAAFLKQKRKKKPKGQVPSQGSQPSGSRRSGRPRSKPKQQVTRF